MTNTHAVHNAMLSDQEISFETCCKNFDRDGYLVLPSFISSEMLHKVTSETNRIVFEEQQHDLVVDDLLTGERLLLGNVPKNELDRRRFKFNDLYLINEHVRALAFANGLDQILGALLGQTPALCNSLTFDKGSGQPLHIDSLYMTPSTQGDLIAIWIAFEDAKAEAGPLTYVKGSHQIKPHRFSDGSFHAIDAEMPVWSKYINSEIERLGLSEQRFLAKAGDVFIWHANLVHGGSPILDADLTRRSIVFHYFSERDCRARGENLRPVGSAWWVQRPPQAIADTSALDDDKNFLEARYLELYPDVAAAVAKGQFKSGQHHYKLFGKAEGRRA